jgi:hypothetical protein
MITAQSANPFVLLMNPEEVIRAVESSERLRRLRRHVCRPLDRPAAPTALGLEAAAFDALLDGADDMGDR